MIVLPTNAHNKLNPKTVYSPLHLLNSQSLTREKIELNFMLIVFCGTSKGFIKACTSFIKLFQVPQRDMKIKSYIIFLFQIIFFVS